MNKSCIILFSHADTQEKSRILFESISSLKITGLPIILSSHISVSKEVQDLVDYCLIDSDNFVLREDSAYDSEINFDCHTFTNLDIISNITFYRNIRKISHIPGVFNLYINSFNLAKNLGFEYCCLWEYDFIIDSECSFFVTNKLKKLEDSKIDGFFIPAVIFSDKFSYQTSYPFLSFFNISKFLTKLPKFPINNSKDYLNHFGLELCEHWVYRHFFGSKEFNTEIIDINISNLNDYFKDLKYNLVDTPLSNPLLSDVFSGIFFDSDDLGTPKYFLHNRSKIEIKVEINLQDKDYNFSRTYQLPPYNWVFYDLPNLVESFNVSEKIYFNDKSSSFDYIINRDNLNLSKNLKFYKLNG